MTEPGADFWTTAVKQLPALTIFAATGVFVVTRFLHFLSAAAVLAREERTATLNTLETERAATLTSLDGIQTRCHKFSEDQAVAQRDSDNETRTVIRAATQTMGEVREALRRK